MRQEERTKATRGAVIRAADALFAQRGYADTSIADILGEAKVTRGALYHHFNGKEEIFEAVFKAREAALVEIVLRATLGGATAWDRLKQGCHAFLEACLDPSVQQIVLIDAWSVLGFEAIRRIEQRYTYALLRRGLANAVKEGAVSVSNVDAMANMLLGAISQCAMAIARSSRPKKLLAEAKQDVDRLLDGLARE